MNRRGSDSAMPLVLDDSLECRRAVNDNSNTPNYNGFDGNTQNCNGFDSNTRNRNGFGGNTQNRNGLGGNTQNHNGFDSPNNTSKKDLKSKINDSGVHMKKQLGLLDGIGIIVGIMIGGGIFISPKGVIQYCQSVGMSLVIWALSGLVSTIGALCYAELGTMIPKSGGDYAYITEAFGPLMGFLYLWVALIIIMPTGNAVIGLTFAYYILKPIFSQCEHPPESAVKLTAALIIVFLTWINCKNVKAATKIQDAFTLTKILALGVIIITGMYHLALGHTENYQEPFAGTVWNPGSIALSFYQGLFSYAGWNCLNFVVEELQDPYRNLPKAIIISLPLVTLVYFLVNVAYFAVLTPNQFIASNAVAVTFGNKVLGYMAWVIPVFVACSTFGCLNGGIFASSRLYYVGAREGHLPQALALINVKAFTPVPALLFLLFITMLMLVASDIQMLINYFYFAEGFFTLLSITALLWMRYKCPDRYRPIKIWIGIPIVFFVVSVFLVVLPVIERPIELGTAIGIILSGVPVYYFVLHKKPSERFANFKKNFTCIIQLLTNSLPED